jgi:hypothetical protein
MAPIPRSVKCTAPGEHYGMTFEVESVDPAQTAGACWYNVTDDDGEPLALHSDDCEPCGN